MNEKGLYGKVQLSKRGIRKSYQLRMPTATIKVSDWNTSRHRGRSLYPEIHNHERSCNDKTEQSAYPFRLETSAPWWFDKARIKARRGIYHYKQHCSKYWFSSWFRRLDWLEIWTRFSQKSRLYSSLLWPYHRFSPVCQRSSNKLYPFLSAPPHYKA